ncbi:MAG: hypothetical protein HOI66_22000 [Verrucomicrobia bacterium]|jgi:hypothetical protein|nr:hypothetical protein [Verrucomicrobiota bacterium]MDB4745879.1 hypothetical protein [Verrucomicrobiota bacterium]
MKPILSSGRHFSWAAASVLSLCVLFGVSSFGLRIQAGLKPTITEIPDQTVFGRTILGFGAPVVGPLAFTVGDQNFLPQSLVVSASSDNPSMIENQDVLISGSGSKRFVSITDIGQIGAAANITLTVTDRDGQSESTTFTVTSFARNAILVDNRSPGFSMTGDWRESDANDEFLGSSFVTEATSDSSATFTPHFSNPGDYHILVWWAKGLPNGLSAFLPFAAEYEIFSSSGSSFVRLDQRDRSGQWVDLGVFTFSGSGDEGVSVGPGGDGTLHFVNADAIVFVPSGEAGFIDDVVVDDRDPEFEKSEGWSESGVENEFRGQSLYTYSPQASVSWTPKLARAGNYEVFLWTSRQAREGFFVRRASSVIYEVSHSLQKTRLVVDQNDLESGKWTLLGSFKFDAAGSESVTLLPGSANYDSGSVGADAIRFSPHNLTTVLDLTVDNQDEGFEATGSWRESGSLDEYNSSSIYSTNGGDRAKWSFPLVNPGVFQVFVWYTGALSNGRVIRRNHQARYFVEHAGRKSQVTVDQNEGMGEWVPLGEFEFHGTADEGVSIFASSRSTSADAVRFIKAD